VRVYLVQHAEAKPEEIDPQRRLSGEGIRNAQRVAAFLKPRRITVHSIWHSGKARAQQTAEIFASSLILSEALTHREGLSPNADVNRIQRAVEQSKGDLMIVGHLPFLSKLASMLVNEDETRDVVIFQNACVVCLEKGDAARWRIVWTITPELLS
jgi:phosphohistidine phosphatase